MSRDNVVKYKDEIISYLKQGYTPSMIERKLLPLTLHDISRYFNEVTGLDYKAIQEEAKESNVKASSYSRGIELKVYEKLSERITQLESRLKALEGNKEEESKTEANSLQSEIEVKAKANIKELFRNDEEFRRLYRNSEKKVNSFRMLEASEKKLNEAGFETVFSSNVSAIAVRGDDLIIRFHNSSIYSYANQGKNYERMMAAASKGKWVWRFLRRPNVPYAKIGTLPLPEDTTETDEEIIQPRIATYEVKAVVPTAKDMMRGVLPQIKISPLAMITATNNDIGGNLLTGLLIGVL